MAGLKARQRREGNLPTNWVWVIRLWRGLVWVALGTWRYYPESGLGLGSSTILTWSMTLPLQVCSLQVFVAGLELAKSPQKALASLWTQNCPVKTVRGRKPPNNLDERFFAQSSETCPASSINIYIPRGEIFTTSHPPHQCLPHYKSMNVGAPRFKSSPNNVKEILWVGFRGERDFNHLKPRSKLDPCSRVTALTEVRSHFALNFKQDRLLKPWYLRFDFLKISLLLKWMLPYQKITQGGNSSLPVFALKCN